MSSSTVGSDEKDGFRNGAEKSGFRGTVVVAKKTSGREISSFVEDDSGVVTTSAFGGVGEAEEGDRSKRGVEFGIKGVKESVDVGGSDIESSRGETGPEKGRDVINIVGTTRRSTHHQSR